ncbi:MAG: thioredoxin [Acutalibacteraceae bacterium]
MITKLTEENFKSEVTESNKPVLIDFWAEWCGPCKMLSPIIDEVSEEKSKTVKFCKVNVDEQPVLAAAFNISSIPTLIYIENGETKSVSIGYVSKEDLLKIIE